MKNNSLQPFSLAALFFSLYTKFSPFSLLRLAALDFEIRRRPHLLSFRRPQTMDRSHIANNLRQPRNPLADSDGWINPRLIRVPAGSRGRGRMSVASRGRGRISVRSWSRGRILSNSRRRSRQSAADDEGLIHHLWLYICRSHIGEPAGSVGASPLTGDVTGSEGGSSPTGCVSCSQGGGYSTGGVTGGEGSASPAGGLAGGEGDAIFEVTDSPVMSDEEFVRRYVITDSDKVSWERNKAEAEREVKALFGENCLDP